MNFNDGDFKDLRSKLDIMGFTQTLPVLAIPLVQAIFGDLIKTTECLRDTKKQVASLLEDKTCWELGVEPYKCDNARLLAECNELHLQFLRDREDYELRLCESQRKIRNLETDREHLQSHNVGLQHQLDALLSKQMVSSTAAKRTQIGVNRQAKKPFITTVRSGNVLPSVLGSSSSAALKCTKCNAGVFQKTTTTGKDGGVTVTQTSGQEELDKIQNDLISAGEQLEFYKRKVEARNREIRRLNDMLTGGRPPAALAKDCCYKDVGALSQDIDLLQREKSELMLQVRDFQDKMHDAMQKALGSEEEKRKLQTQLEELKEAALQVEEQANTEIEAREQEIRQLQQDLKHLQRGKHNRLAGGTASNQASDKHNLNERLNLLTRREEELEATNEKHKKKINKMQAKIQELEKELKEYNQHNPVMLDEEKIRLASERDFFQKEYLRLMSKSGSETEIAFLHAQIKSKDEELKALRFELFPNSCKLQFSPQKSVQYETLPRVTVSSSSESTRPSTANTNQSECVQAAICRAERERDCARTELERVRCERDGLREKQLSTVQLHAEELNALRMRNEELNDRLRQLERDKRDLNSARIPAETNLALLKEDLVQMRQRVTSLQAEIEQLKEENSQVSLLNEQNDRIITELQSKLLVAERQRQSADVRASTLDSSRESNRNEVTQLRTDIGVLRQTFISLEHEKDTLLHQLDSKTERTYKLEYELKDCQEKRNSLEQNVRELEEQVRKLTSRNRQRDSELTETSTESKTLRQQIVALKASRDEAIAENGRLMDKLSDAQVEARTLHKKLKDSEQQVANMKQQLHKYVQEVKKAEDLLTQKVPSKLKEKERDELLDHYHCLSQDQVALEGNNQSLECEAAEFRRQICDLECEVRSLKDQLQCRQCALDEIEVQLAAERQTTRCLQRELENARDDLRVQKVNLEARQELCDKLDVEKDKLNAELSEVNEMRKKLERQCEKLRDELQQSKAVKKVTTETTDQMMDRLHSDQQRQADAGIRSKNEMDRLQRLYQETLRELQEERERCRQQEDLANQYEEQARDLRRNLTEDRFTRARTRAVSPRIPSKTL
ncbi:centrosomal protein of 135 kDa isoform X1 [Drosophila kikkawai]|uniref:Centrosomal protein of 135 kDa isoform X1 n=1 Tax=Drosophila kikkawai TaxID=30033 RepID=A0A6P4I6Q3_DROKI|nr:centrosomal protein of 135 kDa isoform X1 [Drosophila kikkawai]